LLHEARGREIEQFGLQRQVDPTRDHLHHSTPVLIHNLLLMKSFRYLALTASLAAAGLLSACGGGGGGDTPADTAPAPDVTLTQGPQTYRLASQFGTVLTLTMDTGAGTFSYSAAGVNMSGSVSATTDGTYLLNTGISASNLRAELQLKDGAVGGTLPMQNPVTGSVATAMVAGANEKLIVKDTSKIATRYVSVGATTSACDANGSACGDFLGSPQSLAKVSATQLTAAGCSVPSGTSPQAALALDPVACPPINGASSLSQRTWTMGVDGSTTSSLTQAPNVFQIFFADFGGKSVGFASGGRPRVSTTPGNGNMGLWFPADQATQAAQFVGTWNFGAKNDRLTFDVKSLTDISVYVTGQAATTTETLSGLTLNQWGIGGNTLPTNGTPSTLFPVFVAGPWAAFFADVDAATNIGLKR
jgi:hypothetical protein